MEKKKLDRKTLKYYARMAAESYVDDPVHVYATKNETLRKKFLYHFMLERLYRARLHEVPELGVFVRLLCLNDQNAENLQSPQHERF